MAIGERIRFIRNLRGMTQKYLGTLIGFPEKTADIRLAQYESGARTPKADITAALAQALAVAPEALTVPDIDTDAGLMHTLFVLEDLRGLKIDTIDGELCIRLEKRGTEYLNMYDMLSAWLEQAQKYRKGEITKDEYDRWRYNYPKLDTSGHWAKVPPEGILRGINK